MIGTGWTPRRAPAAPCNSEQRSGAGIAYTQCKISENNKTQLFVAWAIVVCLVAFTIGVRYSVSNWIIVASVALVPPLVARSFWRTPDQTISESIRDARR